MVFKKIEKFWTRLMREIKKNKLLFFIVLVIMYNVYTTQISREMSGSRESLTGAAAIITAIAGLVGALGGNNLMKIIGGILLIITFPVWLPLVLGLFASIFGLALAGNTFVRVMLFVVLGIFMFRALIGGRSRTLSKDQLEPVWRVK